MKKSLEYRREQAIRSLSQAADECMVADMLTLATDIHKAITENDMRMTKRNQKAAEK